MRQDRYYSSDPDSDPDPVATQGQDRSPVWEHSAQARWDRWMEASNAAGHAVAARMVELAGIGPGSHVLDVGTGLGEPALTAARSAPGAIVIGVDISSQSLEFANRHANAEGLTNCFFVRQDADQLKSDMQFDAILSRFLLMVLTNLSESLAAMRKLLAPQGRLIVAVWGTAREVPFFSEPLFAVTRQIARTAVPGDLVNPFRLGNPNILEAYLRGAGFNSVNIESALVEFQLDSVDEYLHHQYANNQVVNAIIRAQPEEQQPALWEAVRQSVAPFILPSGEVQVSNVAWIAAAEP